MSGSCWGARIQVWMETLLGPAAFRFRIPLFSNQILGFKSHRSGEKSWFWLCSVPAKG